MNCIECKRCHLVRLNQRSDGLLSISCNSPNVNLVEILLNNTKLPLEICEKHSKVAKYYKRYYKKQDGYLCFGCCPPEYYITKDPFSIVRLIHPI